MQKMSGVSLEKIVVSVGLGRARTSPQFEEKILPDIAKELSGITGQKAAIRRAKKSIAGFKVREGDIVGLTVTLRGRRMKDFLEKLVTVVLPRMRDFRGLDLKNIDASGNLTIGIKEHVIFPEVDQDTSRVAFGLEVTLVSGAKSKEEGIELYRQLGIPFKKQNG
ncbi:MAG: 50S ribosomal protein L5 [Patescibacteria group bacterium]|nr:50S ribosomal protein L5 [Patescibacteria group bacterium]